MFVIIGILIVIGSIIGGYLMEHGQLLVLLQPAELVIIGGAALGTVLIANPLPTIIAMFKGTLGVLAPSRYTKAFYTENLKLLYELFSYAKKAGKSALEAEVDGPSKSKIFAKYPKFLKDHHACHFLCDTLRTGLSGTISTFDLDQLLEIDMEVSHHEANAPVAALTSVADALPGLGIVAAVLGVVVTMGALGGPPEEIGHKVAAALVGTFLGILLCYGFLGPLAANMSKLNEGEGQFHNVLRVSMMLFLKDAPPILAVEFGRRAVPPSLRPGFSEMEKACRGGGSAGAEEAKAA